MRNIESLRLQGVEESSTIVRGVALYLVLKVSKVSVVATGVNAIIFFF